MQLDNIWTKTHEAALPTVVVVSEIVVAPAFPTFKAIPRETKYNEDIRWKMEHAELAAAQHEFINASLCLAYVAAMANLNSIDTNSAGEVEQHMRTALSNIFKQASATRYSTVRTTADLVKGSIMVEVEYGFATSLRSHTLYISNRSL